MRTRLPYVLLVGLIGVVAFAATQRGDDKPESTADTVDLTLQVEEDSSGAEPIDIDVAGDGYELIELRSAGSADLRVHRIVDPDSACPSVTIRVGVSTVEAVGIVETGFFEDPDSIQLESRFVGTPEGDYTLVIVASVPASVTELSAGDAEEAVFDRAAPVDGIVVLALHTGVRPTGLVSVNATYADGSTEILEIFGEEWISDVGGCFVTPDYPEVPPPSTTIVAGDPLEGERPEDRAAIVATYDFWYNAEGTTAEKQAVLDDPDGVVEAQQAVDEIYGTTIATAEAIVDGIEFLSDTEAQVHFHINVGGSPNFWEIGRAVLIDGTWRITRDTVCPLIALGGQTC